MIKVMVLLTRRPDMTHGDFVRWWLEEHLPLAGQLPHARRATLNVVDQDPDGSGIDGVGEVWFDSVDEMQAAYASDIGRAVVSDSVVHTLRRQRLIVDERPQIDDRPCGEAS